MLDGLARVEELGIVFYVLFLFLRCYFCFLGRWGRHRVKRPLFAVELVVPQFMRVRFVPLPTPWPSAHSVFSRQDVAVRVMGPDSLVSEKAADHGFSIVSLTAASSAEVMTVLCAA